MTASRMNHSKVTTDFTDDTDCEFPFEAAAERFHLCNLCNLWFEMPELPEVELVRRELRPVMEGARFDSVVTNRPNLRTAFPADFAARLEGRTVRSLDRRGKYLLAALSSGDVLVMHLGMSGSFRIDADADPDDRHDHVVFRMSSGATIVFNDPRRFGFMDVLSHDRLAEAKGLGALGPEPLSRAFDARALARACRRRKTSLKAALSDQRVVAGLGNIYVSEALHLAQVSPKRRASTIATRSGTPRDSAIRLARAIKKTLQKAIRGSDRFRVYDREGKRCATPGCRGVIRRMTQGGRSTFFCPVCQK
jgi:formamidopyrimidine-DNA glycosylase